MEEEMDVRAAIQGIARRTSAPVRLSADHGRTAAAGLAGEPQTRGAAHARGQPAGGSAAGLCGHDGFAIMSLEVYLNLASRLTLTGINQLWVADITYIRLRAEFVYLAVILDGYSRKVVGWALDRTLAARLPMAALHACHRGAATAAGVGASLRSWRSVCLRGVCEDAAQHQMIPSMSRPANPYDNASCESFMKTLKREEIYANTYRDLEHLRANMEAFIDQYYNRDPAAFGAGLSSTGGVRTHHGFHEHIGRSDSAVF